MHTKLISILNIIVHNNMYNIMYVVRIIKSIIKILDM